MPWFWFFLSDYLVLRTVRVRAIINIAGFAASAFISISGVEWSTPRGEWGGSIRDRSS